MCKEHGTKDEILRGQKPITEDDFAFIPQVVQNADQIYRSAKDYNGKPVIEFVADIGNNQRMNVTVVVSSKHLDVFVQTMYINQKSGSLATPTDDQASVNTPKASSGTASTNNTIPQSSSENNPSGENNFEPRSEREGEELQHTGTVLLCSQSVTQGDEHKGTVLLEHKGTVLLCSQ